MKIFNLITLVFFCFSFSSLFAQNEKNIEADILKTFKRIDYWRQNDTIMGSSDSLEKANHVFVKKLKGYIQKYPAIITYPFNSLVKDELDISTSADGLFRIYSWDTETGGTMHIFANVLQYKSGESFKAIIDTPKAEVINIPNYRKMFTFKTNGHTYYLVNYSSIGSSKDVGDGMHIFTIENGQLKDAKVIKTHSGLHSELSYSYDFDSVMDMDLDKRPTIRFDNVTNTIYIPLVDGNRKMTKKFIAYKFTGQYFEKGKN